MQTQLFCPDERRKARVRDEQPLSLGGTPLNGIDYLQVLDDEAPPGTARQQLLLVHCLQPVAGLTEANVVIEGGVRVRPVRAVWARAASPAPAGLSPAEQAFLAAQPHPERILAVRTDLRGDFSTYTLRLVLAPTDLDRPAPDFDELLSAVPFSFKVDCPSDFDCGADEQRPQPPPTSPQLDYLTKDYAGFRRLMLDRLAVLMPDWQERNPADLGVTLVELLAYAADGLSYYQDAVATEAYLGTARRRPSLHRHARLTDYPMHDGANALAWVCVDVDAGGDGAVLPAGTPIMSSERDGAASMPPEALTEEIAGRAAVFETLHEVRLLQARNTIQFHTWGDPHCCLPQGATEATLAAGAADLQLNTGDVLVFEEVLGPSGLAVDADPGRRHAVRLDRAPVKHLDPLAGAAVLQISWHAEDSLPFALCLWEFPTAGGQMRTASVAHGNVVLADHGRTVGETLPEPASNRRYRPPLQRRDLTQARAYVDGRARREAAAAAMAVDLRQVSPAITLDGDGDTWRPRRDLLNSDRFAAEFVVETEQDGTARLRFGDGVRGRRPAGATAFLAAYRVGNGEAGNVGADALTRAVTRLAGITGVRNPLPATGGTEPEPLERVRLYAPEAFRGQERAVTEADWEEVAGRHPEVQRAAATRRWTGSWYTIFVTVDRRGGRPVDQRFEQALRSFLDRYRLAGYDLEIDAPRFVPLDVAFTVCVDDGYLRADVHQALAEAFSNRDLADGRRGVFHPDNFTFGQPVHLSRLVAAAMKVPGVAWVAPLRFQRWREDPRSSEEERLRLGRLEIARLDNDPSLPENGKLEFDLKGGL
jgi:hypothetical protein